MDVQTEVHLEAHGGVVEILAGPTGRRKWSDEVKGQIVAESFVPGVTVQEIADRYGIQANHLSTWRGQAKRGDLVVPALKGTDFAEVVVDGIPAEVRAQETASGHVNWLEVEAKGVIIRMAASTPVSRLVKVAMAMGTES